MRIRPLSELPLDQAEVRATIDRLDTIDDPRSISHGVTVGASVFVSLAFVTFIATARRGHSRARTGPKTATGKNPPRSELASSPSVAPGSCTVRRISIAFDWSERARLQATLDSIASQVDTSSASGLFAAARRARDAISSALSAARYAMFQSIALSPSAAEAEFARQATSLRDRFGQLTRFGRFRTAAPDDLAARRDEGEGLVVVSLVIASRERLPPLPDHLDSSAIARALANSIPSEAEPLVGLEVVWSPAEDLDRLSSAELEAVYPELLPFGSAGAIGRVACGYCHAIYARELLHCPACGANDPHASRATATGYTTIACGYCGRQTPSYEVQCQHCGGRAAS